MGENGNNVFGDFVVGENKLACLVAETLLEGSLQYNPVYFYGSTASGKTMLLRTMAKQIKKRYPDKNIVYWNSEAYVNTFIELVRKDSDHLYTFKAKNREADILFFDDFEFLVTGNKKQSIQAFFQMWDELYLSQKQIIIASNLKPKDIDLNERYKSRLLMGLACEMYCPDVETRAEILRRECEKQRAIFKPEILMYVARRIQNAGALSGAFNRLMALDESTKRSLNINQVEMFLSDMIPKEKTWTIDSVMERVAAYFRVPVTELAGRSRSHEIVTARKAAMYITKKMLPDLSLKKIGKAFNRDYSSVIHAVDSVEAELRNGDDTVIREAVDYFMNNWN